MPLKQRKLGSQGLVVSEIGLGCMGMTAFYHDIDPRSIEEENIVAIGEALSHGLNFFDTAWIYQAKGYSNETLVGKAMKRYGREKFIVATKFGIEVTGPTTRRFNGKPEFVRAQLADSLTKLDTDYVDLYYQHRMDPDTPIEETMTCLKELVNEGKIKYIGLSECSPTELRRAHAVHPVSAIQMEWSLNSRDLEQSVIPVARELGVGIVAYSPLGRGLLTGAITSVDSFAPTDYRRFNPRFANGNLEKNLAHSFFDIAARKGCTPAQLALAWVLARGEDVIPIPGSKSVTRILENIGAADVNLTPEEWLEVEASIPEVEGDRYAPGSGVFTDRM